MLLLRLIACLRSLGSSPKLLALTAPPAFSYTVLTASLGVIFFILDFISWRVLCAVRMYSCVDLLEFPWEFRLIGNLLPCKKLYWTMAKGNCSLHNTEIFLWTAWTYYHQLQAHTKQSINHHNNTKHYYWVVSQHWWLNYNKIYSKNLLWI